MGSGVFDAVWPLATKGVRKQSDSNKIKAMDRAKQIFNLHQVLIDAQIELYGSVSSNLPGWRWATITKVALDRLSRSLHSDVCDSDGLRDAAIHSTISGSGGRRERAASYISIIHTVSGCKAWDFPDLSPA